MKVNLLFDLDNDDEFLTIKHELDDAMNGAKYRGMLADFHEGMYRIFRNVDKTNTAPFIEGELSDEQYDTLDKFRDYYYKHIFKEIE